MGIKHVSNSKDEEWQELESESIGGFWMHTYRDKQTTGQEQKNIDETNQLLIQSFQCRQNKE